MTFYCEEWGVDEYVHTFAPTGNFKCCCDSVGNDAKRFLHESETRAWCRCIDAWECFDYCYKKMPPPRGDVQLTKQFQITARHHRFVCYKRQETREMRGQIQAGKVIFLDDEAEAGEDVPDIRGIRDNVYQLRVTAAQKGTRTIYRRSCTCWCARCAAGDYENCVTDAAWSFVDLTPKP
jgi:hypothetical protein